MIKTRINNEYKDAVKIFGGGTLQKEIIKVWSREAQEYVYESSVEYTGALPITINADGNALIDYRIYGADGGVGEPTESGEPAGYKLPMTVQSANLFDKNSDKVDGYINDSGDIVEGGNKIWTYDYIAIHGGVDYTYLSYKITLWYSTIRVAWFDANKTFISRTYVIMGAATPRTVLSPSNARYARLSIDDGVEDVIFIKGSTAPTEYIPYNKQTIPVYIGENQLEEDEYVSYSGGKIYRMVDGTLTPTDPPVPLPDIPTIKGETVIDYDGTPKPSQMYVKYRR